MIRFFFEMIRTVLVMISKNNEMTTGFNYIFKTLPANCY
jgi:hypothetical protein